MGSVIAAGFALGWNEQELVAGVRKIFVESRPLSDYAVPVAAFLRGRRFADAMHTVFGETLIEDLWLGFACVSGNLTRGEPAVHDSGPLWKAVMTSCSIPGLVPPIVHGTDLHVDGGVANNLPDDVLRARGQGPVIAVDIGPSVDLSIDARYTEYPPGWKVLAHNVNPFDKVAVPTLLHILTRTAMLSSHAATERARVAAALYLRPRVEKYPFLDFRPIEPIADEGYRSTAAEIAAWKKSLVF
jgi:NTE family protein